MTDHAVEVVFKQRGWVPAGTQRWQKPGSGLWIQRDRDKRGFAVLAGTPSTGLYRITGYSQTVDSLKERCRLAGLTIEFAERIAPLADWQTAASWRASKELGEKIQRILLAVMGTTKVEYAQHLDQQAEQMLEVFRWRVQ